MMLEHCAGQSEVAVGPLFIRKIHLTSLLPDVLPHTHAFGHITFFMGGTIRVRMKNADGVVKTVDCVAGDWLHIPAGVEHAMRALTPDAVCACVFANRDPQGKLTEAMESLIPTQ